MLVSLDAFVAFGVEAREVRRTTAVEADQVQGGDSAAG
jgi:hypothetical protein